MPACAGISKDDRTARRPADVRPYWVLEDVFDIVFGQTVPRDVLDVAERVIVTVPANETEIHPLDVSSLTILLRSATGGLL
jgi:hypothetical protein